MKIFSSKQIRDWDAFTIKNEPIPSSALMERAAEACVKWIVQKFDATNPFKVFCGRGNNGGDGLAISRLLLEKGLSVKTYIVQSAGNSSKDFYLNYKRLLQVSDEVYLLDGKDSFPVIEKHDVLVDALFGTGLNKTPSGIYNDIISHVNSFEEECISIDIPSGMYVNTTSCENAVIKANHTLTFQQLKFCFLLAENEAYFGEVTVLDIGLSPEYYEQTSTSIFTTTGKDIKEIYRPRTQFANKGNYGYACLVAGSYGMMGAAVLSARACLRSGVGKLTCYICKDGYTTMQTAVPEAMCKVFGKTFLNEIDSVKGFDSVGIGPGIGMHASHHMMLKKIFSESTQPLVMDADALNTLSKFKGLYKKIPAGSILTPHPKEFERLFGKSENDFDRLKMAREKAKELNIYIILKGHRTFVATPYGKGYFNTTGNAGMATAGSGDVLTGILTALLAQGYSSLHSCLLGVYIHGVAGDFAATQLSKEAMIASDIIDNLGEAFLQIETSSSS